MLWILLVTPVLAATSGQLGSGQPLGSNVDVHGCRPSTGFVYCVSSNTCLRPADCPAVAQPRVGGQTDSHNCRPSTGYVWCAALNSCQRPADCKGAALPAAPLTPPVAITLPRLLRYPGYNGTLTYSGRISLEFRPNGVQFTYNLQGIEPKCATPGTAPNSCGLHIHVGTTCATAGGHYWDNVTFPTDPWSTATYKQPNPGMLSVTTGFDFNHTKGRAVVVHDFNGNRVSCALIPTTAGGANTYDRAAAPVMVPCGNTQCPADVGCGNPSCNCCGMCSQMLCEPAPAPTPAAALVPCGNTQCPADVGCGNPSCNCCGMCTQMLCAPAPAPIPVTVTLPALNRYPGYNGTLAYSGNIDIKFRPNGVQFTYTVKGFESTCRAAGRLANSCGLHIHAGTTCANAGGHYWNNRTFPNDPWTNATYKLTMPGTLAVTTGFDYNHTKGRVVVLHDFNGTRVACARIPATPVRPVANQKLAMKGGQTDSHGCASDGGYAWCQKQMKCLRSWECL